VLRLSSAIEATAALPTLVARDDSPNSRSNVRVRSSFRIVCPACFDAQVANVHQFAGPPPVSAANARDSSP
jgi:hypothetical protein